MPEMSWWCRLGIHKWSKWSTYYYLQLTETTPRVAGHHAYIRARCIRCVGCGIEREKRDDHDVEYFDFDHKPRFVPQWNDGSPFTIEVDPRRTR